MLQLYLLEIFIEDIHFTKNISSCPKPKDLIVTATLSNFISFEIQIAEFANSNDNIKPSNTINFNSGKSCLFPITPQDLIAKLENNPLLIVISTIGKCMAVIRINWDTKFLDMIKKTIRNPVEKPPVIVRNKYDLKDEQTHAIIGDITAQIRLVCFGEQIQSNYRALKTGTILVKSQQESTIFECQRYGDSSSKSTVDMPPIAPLYYPSAGNAIPEIKLPVPPPEPVPIPTLAPEISPSPSIAVTNPPLLSRPPPLGRLQPPPPPAPIIPGSEFSTITLLNHQFPPRVSVFNVDSVATFDIVSLFNRPDENKFFNLDFGNFNGQKYGSPGGSQSTGSSGNKLTIQKINRSLCKNRNCPAAIKFKEYGIGPLANGTGLGTITNYVKLPAKYGLSNTYGIFDHYGPYGLLSKPDKDQSQKINESTKPLRLNGGGSGIDYHTMPLRLSGSGAINYQTIRSPLVECQDIMRQFDRLLEKFRSSLSPCGQANCPYAHDTLKDLKTNKLLMKPLRLNGGGGGIDYQTMPLRLSSSGATNYQKIPLRLSGSSASNYQKIPLRLSGGGAINYQTIRNPFVECQDVMRQFDRILEKFHSSLSPCGQASCPHAQDILKDLKTDEVPPIFSGKCIEPPTMCYSPEKKLPPIHWDCPEPLPEGVCKNPQCPHLPEDIQELNRHVDTNRSRRRSQTSCEISSRGVCGNPTCPYAETDTASLTCTNPKCPFRYPEIVSKIPEDLQKFITCENPNCPYLTKCKDSEELLTETTICNGKPKKTPYRPSIESDEKPNLEVQYTSDTRLETEETLCQMKGCRGPCANISSDDKIVEPEPKPKRIRKKQRFDFTIGDQYPGVRFGHHQCKPAGSPVPGNQGWLWNLYPRRGWRPGVIQKVIADRIREHWERKGIPMLRLKQFQRGQVPSDEEIFNVQPKPTLQVQKKDGDYYVTLHPLKDPRTLAPNENPYMNCTPLQFKITEKKKVVDNTETCICSGKSESTASSDSDLDIEFTSPAGLIVPERFKKIPNIVHCDTQYDPKDFDERLKNAKKNKKGKKDKKDKKKKKGK